MLPVGGSAIAQGEGRGVLSSRVMSCPRGWDCVGLRLMSPIRARCFDGGDQGSIEGSTHLWLCGGRVSRARRRGILGPPLTR